MKPTVCLIEDDINIVIQAKRILTSNGYEIKDFSNFKKFVLSYRDINPDVIVLDSKTIGDDLQRAITFCSELVGSDYILLLGIEKYRNIPCLNEPYTFKNLLVKISEITRECKSETIGKFTFVMRNNEVIYKDRLIKFTNKEFQILKIIVSSKDIVDREEILKCIWGYDFAYKTRTVDMHINAIRKKLQEPNIIMTVYGKGYYYQR